MYKRTMDNGLDDARQRMPAYSNRSPGWLRWPKTTLVGQQEQKSSYDQLSKMFCSETPVWELVVTHQEFSVFIPFDLTKWNCSNCWLNLISYNLHYRSKKRRKQIESRCRVGITNQRKSVYNVFQYLNYALTLSQRSWGGGFSVSIPLPSFPFNYAPFWHLMTIFF